MDFKDLLHLNGQEFRDEVEFFVDNENEYSKEELYDIFVLVTKRYLDEVISARQLENLFVETYGEKATNDFYEAVANSSETVAEGDVVTAMEDDIRFQISSQFDLIEKLNSELG